MKVNTIPLNSALWVGLSYCIISNLLLKLFQISVLLGLCNFCKYPICLNVMTVHFYNVLMQEIVQKKWLLCTGFIWRTGLLDLILKKSENMFIWHWKCNKIPSNIRQWDVLHYTYTCRCSWKKWGKNIKYVRNKRIVYLFNSH